MIKVDAGAEAVILVRPRDWRFTPARFQFSYAVVGDQYAFYEKYFLGPDGMTWLIVALSVAGFIALLLVIAIIIAIVYCFRKKEKV